jgi:hypothetical protein
MSLRWILCFALTPLAGLPASAQSVISAHAGLIHFADGSVFLDDQRIEQKAGKFDQMKNGSELRTQDGRAEVLLTPGTFLRIGANSAVRMVSNDLDNTRVELLNGSAVLDQGSDTIPNTSVTILYNLDQVHIKKAGRYRFDSAPPQVKVESGDVDVTAADGKSVEAGAGYVVAFEGKLTARKLLNDSGLSNPDDLENWSSARNHSVADGNQDAAAATDLSVYGPGLYGPGLYGSALYGPGLAYGAYGPYGLGAFGGVSPLYYLSPVYLPYRAPYGYRGAGAILPGRAGTGRPLYQSPGGVRMGVGVGHPGGGAMHVGGHH